MAVAFIAIALVVWSFYRVIHRNLTRDTLREGEIQLTVVHWGDKGEDAVVAGLVRDFESLPENKGIHILRVNPGQAAAVNTKLQTMFAAGDPPDVFYLGYEKVADFGSKDLLSDIEPLIKADNAAGDHSIDLDDFYPAVVKCFRYNKETARVGSGELVGLPKDFTTAGFYYNKDLFRRAGIPEPPRDEWTWDEFIAAARAIGKLDGCYGADFVTWEAMVRLWVWTHGADFGTPGWQKFSFDDPRLIEALEKLRMWFHDGSRTLVSAKTQLETNMEPFLAGNVGMAGPFGRWKIPVYRLITKFDWDFAPLPHAAGHPPRNGIYTAAWAIARKSPHQKEAWRFIKYLGGRRGQEQMCAGGLAVPVLKSVAESKCFSDPDAKPHNFHLYLDALKNAEPIDWPADPIFLHQLRVRLEDIFKLNKPVGPAMKQVGREWEDNRRKAMLDANYPPMPWARVATCIAGPLVVLLVVLLFFFYRGRPHGQAFREELAGGLMVSPWVIGFLTFTAFPIVLSLLLAFTKWSGLATLDHANYVGWNNFRALFEADSTFRNALRITALYALLAVPTSQIAALVAAMLMNREWKTIGIFRAIWYLPSVLAGVGVAVMWKWVFHHEHGLIKAAIDPLLPTGAHSPAWFEKDATSWAVPAFVIINLWSIGGTMMIYLAGLKGIPKDLYEAAEIDGALGWRKFVNVTLPMLSPVIFFNVIIAVIASFQIFTTAYVMTGGGPGDASRFFVVYLFNQAFDFHDMGYASAMAWLLLVIVLVLTLAMMKGTKRFVYYEALKA
jgi:multiple sugar transport system permease protein